MSLDEAVFAFNRPYESRARGALIHKISPEDAAQVAGELWTAVPVLSLLDQPPRERACYFAAVIGQESRFDARAINMNLSLSDAPLAFLAPAWETFQFHLQRNSPLLLKGDYGVSMFKLKYLVVASDAKGCTADKTPADMITECSFSAPWALRLASSRYAGLLRWAETNFPTEDPRWVAAGAYNQGQKGFQDAYHDHSKPAWAAAQRHIARCRAHYHWFLNNLTEDPEG